MNAPPTAPTPRPSVLLHRVLWLAQILLALPFVGAGWMKVSTAEAELMANMGTSDASAIGMIRALGACELAGAVGLILPAALRIQPKLTPLAAALLALIMVGATVLHASKAEWGPSAFTAALFGLGVFVAWGRGRRAPIAPK